MAKDLMQAPRQSRDVLSGDYTYRQFEDGSITIIRKSRKPVTITAKSNTTAWKAITEEIGTWQDYKRGKTVKQVGTVAQYLLASVLEQAFKGHPSQKNRSHHQDSAPEIDVPAPAPPPPDAPRVPLGVWIGGVLVLGAVIVVAVSSGGSAVEGRAR